MHQSHQICIVFISWNRLQHISKSLFSIKACQSFQGISASGSCSVLPSDLLYWKINHQSRFYVCPVMQAWGLNKRPGNISDSSDGCHHKSQNGPLRVLQSLHGVVKLIIKAVKQSCENSWQHVRRVGTWVRVKFAVMCVSFSPGLGASSGLSHVIWQVQVRWLSKKPETNKNVWTFSSGYKIQPGFDLFSLIF